MNTAFEAMMARDPDGQPNEPTEADYERFEAWAVSTFGRDAYDAYMLGEQGCNCSDPYCQV